MLRRKLSKAKVTALAVALCMISMSVKDDGALASANRTTYYTWPVPLSAHIDKSYEEGNDGIDIVCDDENAEVVATLAGTVEVAKSTDCIHTNNYPNYCCNKGLGNYVKIRHEDGTYSVYSHLKYDSVTVSEGASVEAGQIIGIMGESGRTAKKCLHFVVAYSDTKSINTNPDVMNYVFTETESTSQNKQEGELWRVISDSGVNFRSGAGTTFQVLGKIPYDEKVRVVETIEIEDLQWGKTTFEGETGWFALKYAEPTNYEGEEETEMVSDELKYYKVKFNCNGGECEYSSYMYAKGAQIGNLPTPTKQGATFLGWYTEKEEGTALTQQTEVVEDMTIYAHWN